MRTATGLHVYTYRHSIIARLDQLKSCSDDAECGQAERALSCPERAWPAPRDDTWFTASMLAATQYTGCKPK